MLEGETTLHRLLLAERDRLLNEFRLITNNAGQGAAWLERVKFHTTAPTDVTLLLARDDTIGALLRSLRSLANDQEALAELSDELADLKRKLPSELANELALDDPTVIARLLADVEHLLLPRLAGIEA